MGYVNIMGYRGDITACLWEMRAGYTKSCLNQKTFTWFLVNQQVMVFLWDLRAYFYRDIMVNHLIGVCLKM